MSNSLVVGDWVEVRSAAEILATLDDRGTLEALPFMPEMLAFIGKRFPVLKRIHKTCDTIDKTGLRRMKQTVALAGVRCDGGAHGGCQAGCMIFWKEQWLKKVSGEERTPGLLQIDSTRREPDSITSDPTYAMLDARVRKVAKIDSGSAKFEDLTYMCLITEMKKASLPLAWWDFRQYIEDVTSGNRRLWEVIRGLLLMLFNWVQIMRGGVVFPFMGKGSLQKTPTEDLQLKPGDYARVKSVEAIVKTLDSKESTRGLRFDVGMFRYCGGQYRVVTRACRLIDQRTGKMLRMKEENPCIVLEGVICHADYMKFCPRTEYLFWREAWLEKVPQ